MGLYSEKTQREVDKYFKHLVRRMPAWLKKLFQEKKIAFSIDPDGVVALDVDTTLDDKTKHNSQAMIARYMEKHPCKAMEILGAN